VIVDFSSPSCGPRVGAPSFATFSRTSARRSLCRHVAFALAGVVALMALPPLAARAQAQDVQASVTDLGCLYSSICFTEAFAVSDGGSVVTGWSVYGAIEDPSAGVVPLNEAFRWTPSGMTGLGFLDSNTDDIRGSFAFALSADGSVIVGMSSFARPADGEGNDEAFVWSEASGKMTGLGFLGKNHSTDGIPDYQVSMANAVSADGSTVGGVSSIDTTGDVPVLQAFLWTQGTGMTGLGALQANGNSSVVGLSSDGSVAVGQSDYDSQRSTQAFRWTRDGGMAALGFLPGLGDNKGFPVQSAAVSISADGTVVAGTSSHGAGDHVEQSLDAGYLPEAYRWTAHDGMVGLGFLKPTDDTSWVCGMSADGKVIVGSSSFGLGGMVISGLNLTDFESQPSTAYRWTQATGMQDLNTLLTDARIGLDGWHLDMATAISRDGQFIAGSASKGSDTKAVLVRYLDATSSTGTGSSSTPPPIVGMTTAGSVQSSMRQLNGARAQVMAQAGGLAAPVLGDNEPIKAATEAGAFGSVGSRAAGVFGQVAPIHGLSLRAGLARQYADFGEAAIERQTMLGGGVRYVFGGERAQWMPYAELGGWTTLNARYRFSRSYANGAGTARGAGEANGKSSYVFGRAGLLLNASKTDQLSWHVEAGRAKLSTDAYEEPASSENPFPAGVSSTSSRFHAVKLGMQWDHAFAHGLSASLFVQRAWAKHGKTDMHAVVAGFGEIAAQPVDSAQWWAYGLRTGFAVRRNVTVDLFADGVAGGGKVGSDAHVGVDLRITF
jgi:probable HAF family extracellular repeat protein